MHHFCIKRKYGMVVMIRDELNKFSCFCVVMVKVALMAPVAVPIPTLIARKLYIPTYFFLVCPLNFSTESFQLSLQVVTDSNYLLICADSMKELQGLSNIAEKALPLVRPCFEWFKQVRIRPSSFFALSNIYSSYMFILWNNFLVSPEFPKLDLIWLL